MEQFDIILKGNGNLEGAIARQRYFLTTADLADLNYSIPPWHGWGMGRPTKLYKAQDLVKRAEQKYGKEGFLEKLRQREEREKKRKLSYEKKEKEQQARESKRQKLLEACPDWGRQPLTDSASVGALAQKCSMEQLQQILVLAAEKSPLVIEALNAAKEEGLLPRKDFKQLHSKLARYFASDADEALKRSAEKAAQAAASQARQTELNSGIDGEWELKVTSNHPKVKGMKGELKIDEVGGPYFDDYEDYVDFGDGVYFGGLQNFKGKSSVEDRVMQIETKWKFCGRRVTGLLRVRVGEDGDGRQFVEGSFKAGAQERNWPVTLQFTGNRKGELEEDLEPEGDENDQEGLCEFLTELEEAG
ncbi:PREDICTED: uncharacterized protein LOC109462765 isoform X1 [Branchiostoma belcheri]|uniref:Uncharacterized protein LOC109462765 isoform X1 n=1 Tax=Branchiostoma belcheri TaxID=7741 RepID=A0A6P4XS86_BRABE|nr:PREDICTED: uncharacterized protein LOC109462765 isoform X1 [Branchiostoma belcheri]